MDWLELDRQSAFDHSLRPIRRLKRYQSVVRTRMRSFRLLPPDFHLHLGNACGNNKSSRRSVALNP